MKHWLDDTIAAIATPSGVGGIGIIRLSGPASLDIASKIFRQSKSTPLETHRIYHGWISAGDTRVDEGLLSYMAGPNSYTGEDVVEINCHGGKLAARKTLELALEAGARLAEKGEFTRRAFLNGRMDLIRAEAVADIISARSERALVAAAAQLGGEISGKILVIREALVVILAGIEASIDFPDDVAEPEKGELARAFFQLSQNAQKLIETAEEGRVVREGIRLAIIGKPNVGKSSLLNKLIQNDRVIVSDLPGTTRDTVEENVVIGGLPFVLVDTAGIRESSDRVELSGVDRALKEAAKADLVMIVLDGSSELSAEDEKVLSVGAKERAVIVINKVDLGIKLALNGQAGESKKFMVSALTGDGLAELRTGLEAIVINNKQSGSDVAGLINARHKECLWRAKEALDRASVGIGQNFPVDLLAIDLRGAIASLGEATGQAVSEEVIENIFQHFCVGK